MKMYCVQKEGLPPAFCLLVGVSVDLGRDHLTHVRKELAEGFVCHHGADLGNEHRRACTHLLAFARAAVQTALKRTRKARGVD